MKIAGVPRGYTILEVMIVLAVTSALFIAVASTISGQQARSEFAQAVRETDSKLQDIMNDVGTGYYADLASLQCSASSGGPVMTSGTYNKGTNADCIYVGRVMQFAPHGSNGEFIDVINVAGLRLDFTKKTEAINLTEAKPVAIADPIEKFKFQAGARLISAKYDNGGGSVGFGSMGIFSDFTSYNGTNLQSGARNINVIPISTTTLGQTFADTALAIKNNAATSVVNPSKSVILCLQSAGSNQHALINIGGLGRRITTSTAIQEGPCT